MTGLTTIIIVWLIYSVAVALLIILLWRFLNDFFTPLMRNLLAATIMIWLLVPSPVPDEGMFAPCWLIATFEAALGNGTTAWQAAEPALYFWLLFCIAILLHYYFRYPRPS